MARVLVVDDDALFLKTMQRNLVGRGYAVETCANPAEVMEMLDRGGVDCLLLDVRMPGIGGLDLVQRVVRHDPPVPVVMISGEGSVSAAVEALKRGAYDFLEKPVDPDKLDHTIQNAIRRRDLQEENSQLMEELEAEKRLVGDSDVHRNLLARIARYAESDARVLITGESGTGKELVAWAIHHHSERRGRPYIAINCAAVPRELLGSELFGHRKGAFTGAGEDRKGKFVAADGGTLFLDEIGDMDIDLQAKLLRVLENMEVEVLGENQPRPIDVRILAATNQDLEAAIENGTFRRDLLFRLKVLTLEIPPLRERREDVLPLVYHFLARFRQSYNRPVFRLTPRAETLLINYHWPGNVRELRGAVERLVVMGEGEEIDIDAVMESLEIKQGIRAPDGTLPDDAPQTLKEARNSFEKRFIEETLARFDWRIGDTAASLGIDRTSLFRKMQQYGIEKPE